MSKMLGQGSTVEIEARENSCSQIRQVITFRPALQEAGERLAEVYQFRMMYSFSVLRTIHERTAQRKSVALL
jgi:hypothetical protein